MTEIMRRSRLGSGVLRSRGDRMTSRLLSCVFMPRQIRVYIRGHCCLDIYDASPIIPITAGNHPTETSWDGIHGRYSVAAGNHTTETTGGMNEMLDINQYATSARVHKKNIQDATLTPCKSQFALPVMSCPD